MWKLIFYPPRLFNLSLIALFLGLIAILIIFKLMKKRVRVVVLALSIVFTLFIYEKYCIYTYPIIPVNHYISSDGGFSIKEYPTKGGNFDVVLSRFEKYRMTAGEEVTLYRTFKRRWDNIYLWHDNFTHPRWKLPLKKEK